MASVAQIPATPQQQQLAAIQAAQAAAYHNDMDPAKVTNRSVPGGGGPHPSTISYEEVEDPPTRTMAYFHLVTHQASIYMTFVLVSLVIAFSIVYNDTTDLRDDVSNNVRRVCKDVTDALLSYFALVVITGFFAVLTWSTWYIKKWLRYLPVVCGILFLASSIALAVYNVAGTVAFGKPTSTACYNLGLLDSTEAYYMIEGALIVIWVTMGLPTFLIGLYIFYNQARDLAADFPSDRKLRDANRQERELLMVPANPNRAFRYP
jgi:hypothetical protein